MPDVVHLQGDLLLSLTARDADDTSERYTPLSRHSLDVVVHLGDTSPDGVTEVVLQVRAPQDRAWAGVIHVELAPAVSHAPRFFLPAFMYGRNRGDAPMARAREWPRLRASSHRPASEWWMTRGDRLSHPVALVLDVGRLYGLDAAPYLVDDDGVLRQATPGEDDRAGLAQHAGFTCSLPRGAVGYTLGYENAPLMFVQTATVLERAPLAENVLELAAGSSLEVRLRVHDRPAPQDSAVADVVEEVYRRYHHVPRRGPDPVTAVRHLAQAVHEAAWLESSRSYAGFVFEDGAGPDTTRELASISWTNGTVVATPMLLAGLRLGRDDIRARAASAIDEIVETSMNPASGLPFDARHDGRWSVRGWWWDGMEVSGHSGYLVGQAVYLVLKAYEAERDLRGTEHAGWLAWASSVVDVLDRSRNADGEYPFLLSERTGAGLTYDSLGSAWALAASARLRRITGSTKGLDDLLAAERHYDRAFVGRMECYGGPLDTDRAVDSEGVVGYVKAVRELHRITGDDQLLDRLRAGLAYEFTFRFCYDTPITVPPLSRLGWSSCGGSVTSVANPHIHPMGATLVDDMLHLLRHRPDDPYVASRLRDTVAWGAQTYNSVDREFDHGRVGWMSERFCHSEGLLTQRYPDGSPASTWFCLMPWASGCVLDGMVGDLWESGLAEAVASAPARVPS